MLFQGPAISQALLLLCLCIPGSKLAAHADIELRIEEISGQISDQPGDAGLYLKRAELYRFHFDWPAAAADYEKVRKLEPQHRELDFLEARFFLDSGQPRKALQQVDGFISDNPGHVTALVTRAGAYQHLDQCTNAATDLARAIELSRSHGPELYLQQARVLLMPGCDDQAQAVAVLHRAVQLIGPVSSIVQLASSIHLSRGETDAVSSLLAQLPEAMQVLPDWRYRQALAWCISSRMQAARRALQQVLLVIDNAPASRQQRWHSLEISVKALLKENGLQENRCLQNAEQLLNHEKQF